MNPQNTDPIVILVSHLDSVRSGKIQAIKAFRMATNAGLKEAKDICEAIQEGCNKSAANNETYFKIEYEKLQKRHEELKSKYSKALSKLDNYDLRELLEEEI